MEYAQISAWHKTRARHAHSQAIQPYLTSLSKYWPFTFPLLRNFIDVTAELQYAIKTSTRHASLSVPLRQSDRKKIITEFVLTLFFSQIYTAAFSVVNTKRKSTLHWLSKKKKITSHHLIELHAVCLSLSLHHYIVFRKANITSPIPHFQRLGRLNWLCVWQ